MWQISPLHTATQHCIRKGMLDRGDPADEVERMDIPFIAFLLRSPQLNRTYLVDCGPDFDNETNTRLHQPMTMLPHWHVKDHLARLGIAPESLAGIIVTHLHWDHFKAAVDLPSSLPAIVQRTELAYASASRSSTYGKPYESDEPDPFFVRCYNQYVLVDGDEEIAPGIRVTLTPGHTKGSQTVLVETDRGRLVLANDVVNVLENWTERIRPGNVNDPEGYEYSLEKLRKYENEGWHIIPGHDFRVFTELAHFFHDVQPIEQI